MVHTLPTEEILVGMTAGQPPMETLNHIFPVGLPWPEFCIALAAGVIIYTFFSNTVINDGKDYAPDYTVPVPDACKPGWEGKLLDEPSVKVSGSSAIQCYCPATGRLLGRVNPATPDGIDRAVVKARDAQVQWAKTTFKQRRRVLRTMLKYILENQEIIVRVACLDSGKTMIDASLGEILVSAEKLQWTIDHGEKALKSERRPTNFLMMYKYNEVRWEPLGVLAACVSWNYPIHNVLSPIISTLFTGSALLIKSSEQTAWSLSYTTAIARAALSACGHSPNLIQPLVCWPAAANHLTSHPGISHITFIGSRPVAHAVCTSAAKPLTPVLVELGGKDPAIILDDVRGLETKVASILMRGIFQSSGQNCIGIERIIALPKSYASLISILEPRIRALRPGSALDDPYTTDIGAMISSSSFFRLESLIADAVAHGARCLLGGTRFMHPQYPRGHYFAPTLLVDVTPDMRIAQEELFAPICVLMRASTVPHALALANSTPYALGASVFGTSAADIEILVNGLHAGMVSVNDFAVTYAVQLPFGGTKGSGYGRFAGKEGLRGICNVKSVTRDRWDGAWWGRCLGLQGWGGTRIPGAMEYPIADAQRGWETCRGVVEVGYANFLGKLRGVGRIVGLGPWVQQER